jgi:hypothetical protein
VLISMLGSTKVTPSTEELVPLIGEILWVLYRQVNDPGPSASGSDCRETSPGVSISGSWCTKWSNWVMRSSWQRPVFFWK